MQTENPKMILAEAALKEAAKAHAATVDEFLQPDRQLSNVVGMGVGMKWKKGQPTGEPALVVFVTQKLDKESLKKSQMVPAKLGDMQTDVLSVGVPMAGGHVESADAQTLAKRVRPAQGGYSVGHYAITAGTIATCVYKILPGGTVSPPAAGFGMPPAYFILSNNHVLANSNAASIGDAILQPGPYDGGINPTDKIATLFAYIPITFYPTTPLASHNNFVDAAIAKGEFHDLNREIYWVGDVHGWRPKSAVTVGMAVKKTGRTTNFTTGRITAINATVDVNYGSGRIARFKDQIMTTPMSAGGDSGSLIVTNDNLAVGLLFAGSPTVTIANQFENVRTLLAIEVWP